MAMIPMIEVINEEIINEPGARFIKERIKIQSSLKEKIETEELKEDM